MTSLVDPSVDIHYLYLSVRGPHSINQKIFYVAGKSFTEERFFIFCGTYETAIFLEHVG